MQPTAPKRGILCKFEKGEAKHEKPCEGITAVPVKRQSDTRPGDQGDSRAGGAPTAPRFSMTLLPQAERTSYVLHLRV